ncbi:response regulator [Natronorubrum sp. FCH18a]|uniref:response regulator n=1 Tax=Natronorubrum sp. FCH18a TaxID=3447018 RepID=UPI003F519BD6
MTPPEDVISILLVEPDPGDATLFVDSFGDVRSETEIDTASDGETALEFVHQRGEYADRPRPDIVFLNSQLPEISGEAVLSEIKTEPALKSIPVIVLTTGDDDAEIRRSYDLHANAALQKPADTEAVASLVRSIENFWLTFVRFPNADL